MLTFAAINQRDAVKLEFTRAHPSTTPPPQLILEPGVLPHITDKQVLCMVVTEFILVVSYELERSVMRRME